MRRIYFGLALIFLLALVSAESVSNNLNLNLQVTDSSGNPTTGTFTFIFSLTNQTDCTGAFYTNSTTLTTDSRGIISYTLTNVNSTFDQKTYLCYYRDGVLKSNISVSQVPNAFKAKNVTVSGLIVDASLNLSQKNISADWFNGKLNYSDIQNHPVFLTQAMADLLYCKITGCTLSGNLVIQKNLTVQDKICNATTCFTLSELNQTGNLTETDSLSIHLDGGSTTTGLISFAEGISIPNMKSIRVGLADRFNSITYDSANNKFYLANGGSDSEHPSEVIILGDIGNTIAVLRGNIKIHGGDMFNVPIKAGDVEISGGDGSAQENGGKSGDIILRGGLYNFDEEMAYNLTGGIVKIGWNTTSSSHGLDTAGANNNESNLLVGNSLEVNGVSYFDSLVSVDSSLNVTKNITIGSLGNPGCISVRDSDDGGWSHLQMLDGAIVNGSGAC